MDALVQEQQELLLRSQDSKPSGKDSYYGSVEAGAAGDDREKMSLLRLMMLNMHAFNYGLFYASVGVILLPEEAMNLFPQQHAMYLAAMLGAAGLSQLISPFAGYLSDRETSMWGRRIPYLVGGNVVLLVMIGALYIAREARWGHAYLVMLLAAIVALNVAYTGFTGLVSDMVAPDQVLGPLPPVPPPPHSPHLCSPPSASAPGLHQTLSCPHLPTPEARDARARVLQSLACSRDCRCERLQEETLTQVAWRAARADGAVLGHHGRHDGGRRGRGARLPGVFNTCVHVLPTLRRGACHLDSADVGGCERQAAGGRGR
jgi:hypothetical protein